MTATPETTDVNHPHLLLTGLAQQGKYAYEFARAGQTRNVLKHLDAIERLTTAYRATLTGDSQSTSDTLPEWLYQRFAKYRENAPLWSQMTDNLRSYWNHEADAVRRAVARSGFKNRGKAE